MSGNSPHRAARVAVVGVSFLLTCAGLVPASAPLAAAAPVPPCPTGTPLASDFDGDRIADLVVGSRRAGVEFADQYLSPGDGSAERWLLAVGSLSSADLNGDTCADAILYHGGHEPLLEVALGTPSGLDVDGAVEVTIPQAADVADDERRSLEFEAAGLRHDGLSQIAISGRHVIDLGEDGPEDYGAYLDLLTLDASLGVSTARVLTFSNPTPWGFGSALATSGRTIAVGHTATTVNGKSVGAVRLYTTDAADPTQPALRKVLTADSPGIPGKAAESDGFGNSLAMLNGRLAIGVPEKDDGRKYAAGLVQPVVWHEATGTYTAYRAITQNTPGVPGANEEDDRFGLHVAMARGLTASGSYDIVIGATERVGTRDDAGSVTVANFSRSIYRTYTQSSKGIPGNPQTGDDFSRVGVLRSASGADRVLIGAPGEDSNGIDDLGRVIVSNGTRLTSKTVWTNLAVPSGAPAGLRNWGISVGADG